jgi:hypothetical protein
VIKVKDDEMGRTYSKHAADENCIQDFNRETYREETET